MCCKDYKEWLILGQKRGDEKKLHSFGEIVAGERQKRGNKNLL